MGKKIEKLKNNSISDGVETEQKITGKGGARPGAGRPKGSENEETRERRIALETFRNRVIKNADKLFNAQVSLALGVQFMFRIDEVEKTGKDGKKYKVKEHVLVTDPEEIKQALDDDLVNGEDYYYISTDKPDSYSINSLLDRTFGKPVQELQGNLGLDINQVVSRLNDDVDPADLGEPE